MINTLSKRKRRRNSEKVDLLLDVNDIDNAVTLLYDFDVSIPYLAQLFFNGPVRRDLSHEEQDIFLQTTKDAHTFYTVEEIGETSFNLEISRAMTKFAVLVQIIPSENFDEEGSISLKSQVEAPKVREKTIRSLKEFLNDDYRYSTGQSSLELSETVPSVFNGEKFLEVSVPVIDLDRARQCCNNIGVFLSLLMKKIGKGSFSHLEGTPNCGKGAVYTRTYNGRKSHFNLVKDSEDEMLFSVFQSYLGVSELRIVFQSLQKETPEGIILVIMRRLEESKRSSLFFSKNQVVSGRSNRVKGSLKALQHYLNMPLLKTCSKGKIVPDELDEGAPAAIQTMTNCVSEQDKGRFMNIKSVIIKKTSENSHGSIEPEVLYDISEGDPTPLSKSSISRVCHRMATRLENELIALPGSDKNEFTRMFEQDALPSISLSKYLIRLVNGINIWYDEVSIDIGLKGLLYATELLLVFLDSKQFILTPYNVHRFAAIVALVSIKFIGDRVISNSGWCIISGIDEFKITELEDVLCFKTDFNFILDDSRINTMLDPYDLYLRKSPVHTISLSSFGQYNDSN